MKYGFMVHDKPVEEVFDYAASHKITHLELDLKKDHSQLPTFTPDRIKRVRDLAERHKISLSLHPPFNNNLCSRVPLVRNHHVAYLKRCILMAHELGVKHITLHLGNFYRFAVWANPRSNALERLYNVLVKLLPLCEETGISLALENMVPIPPEAGYCFLGDNVADFVSIFSRLDSKYLNCCLDIGHANTAEGPLAYINRLGEKLISVHFHDNGWQYDDHLDVGAGTVPWKELLTALDKQGFKGPYVSECFRSEPHEAIGKLRGMR